VIGIGSYDAEGRHVCECGALTRYASMSGGQEFFCEQCGTDGYYPEGVGGPRARLLAQGPEGVALLRAEMDQELARRKEHG
jgi:hypothetical protein